MEKESEGHFSNSRRKQFRYQVPEEVLDAIEAEAHDVLQEYKDQ
ncbi:hypothetical protein QT231_23085 [Halomonas sp. SpR1]|nr:hypothetical protein [Halomonas sp. SpR1]MDQ7735592.1 hypothetical protein [Halomonas sp. SpR1]